MSQQMNYDEARGERQSPPFQSYETGYHDPFIASSGQKLSMRDIGRGASAGQRLALAIVSIVMLVFVTGILFDQTGFISPFLLIPLGMVCLTIIIVNAMFNHNH